ncbi:recombination protein RecT [Stenotrophomonas rhizophila]|uniref:Recombination protein RecT n=1 Tax=Stenotrophomonas rhizophila TaxID=216778 RepID=A0A498CGZ6_9GAMM|nr:recombination protein RecT [Stenotrophomonas rhizophila]RLK56273.1 recombination protein RecT [Stenotrophomonas rhizophila]
MSTSALKAAATGTAAQTRAERPATIAGLLTDPKIKAQMALALPKHISPDRLARIALTEVRKIPKLAQCDQTSFLGAIMQCAALGLEPGGALGHCYLIPFENRRQNRTEVQFIVGYRGMIDLARRSGQIVSLEARAVYAKDHFKVRLGLDSSIEHEPDWEADDRGELTFVYAVAKLRDGGVQFEVMSRKEIERVRNESQGYKTAARLAKPGQEPNSPWASHFEEMAKKTVIRRLFKYLPVSIEIQRAVGLDEQADAGVPQDNPLVIDGEFSHVEQQSLQDSGEQPDGLTAQDVLASITAAQDRDALDSAWDMASLLPAGLDRKPIHDAYQARLSELEAN